MPAPRAARAGTATAYSFGPTIAPAQANYDANYTYRDGERGTFLDKTVPVGAYPANAFGLHDMHGNVWEWVADCWHPNYRGAPTDGSAWTKGGDCSRRVRRGGAWNIVPDDARSAVRFKSTVQSISPSHGFRVARDPYP